MDFIHHTDVKVGIAKTPGKPDWPFVQLQHFTIAPPAQTHPQAGPVLTMSRRDAEALVDALQQALALQQGQSPPSGGASH